MTDDSRRLKAALQAIEITTSGAAAARIATEARGEP